VASQKTSRHTKRKRKRGRPHASEETVGREGIVAGARKLLETLPPHRVTIVMIAKQAGVDPAMVRYYFASREELFLAVTENILMTWVASHPAPVAPPAERLASYVAGMVDFARSARSMQRLMIDECVEAKAPEVRKRILELNAMAVQGYTRLFDANQPDPLESVDPLLAYIAIIGMSEFFVAAQSMIVPLLPQKTSPDELAERYKKFLVKMVLDGLRPRK
jgi:AcrR family transcriptional regulator